MIWLILGESLSGYQSSAAVLVAYDNYYYYIVVEITVVGEELYFRMMKGYWCIDEYRILLMEIMGLTALLNFRNILYYYRERNCEGVICFSVSDQTDNMNRFDILQAIWRMHDLK